MSCPSRDALRALDLPSIHTSTTAALVPDTKGWCWHCCHTFDGPGVPLPIAYDDRRDVWKTMGLFCTFSCAKGYNTDGGGYRSPIIGQLLTLLQKRMTGKFSGIVPAPPRHRLRVFGGTLSIQEFRAKAASGIIVTALPSRMIPLETIMEERKAAERRVKPRVLPNLTESIDFTTTAATKNENLRLRRPRPMPSDTNVLARTMGLTVQ